MAFVAWSKFEKFCAMCKTTYCMRIFARSGHTAYVQCSISGVHWGIFCSSSSSSAPHAALDPFRHRLGLTALDRTAIAVFTVTLAPIRMMAILACEWCPYILFEKRDRTSGRFNALNNLKKHGAITNCKQTYCFNMKA